MTPPPTPSKPLDILILGAGWTYQFLLPLLDQQNLTHAATTRAGSPTTIPFTFTPHSSSLEPYTHLPAAHFILITFPLLGFHSSSHLTSLYATTHPSVSVTTRFIQLGSTGIYTTLGWNDSSSPYEGDDPHTPGGNERAVAEDELLSLHGERACVLNLAGLYGGGDREPRGWVGRVARGKEGVRGKGAVHLVHGRDVARGVVGCVKGWEGVRGRRWIVTDLRCYDWWDLIMGWGEVEGEYRKWVLELMREEGVRGLPREKEGLGRLLDGRGFWEAIGSWPGEGRVV